MLGAMSHPDETEARQWVAAQTERLRTTSYDELLLSRDEPTHYSIESRTGRVLMGETYVFWDGAEGGPLCVTVDICEPKPGAVRSIASDQFTCAPDGSFIGE
jgi:hypothetical protein